MGFYDRDGRSTGSRYGGRVYFAGDYMTEQSSFMQGAFESTRTTAAAIHTDVAARR
jgi:monoamine oxidase